MISDCMGIAAISCSNLDESLHDESMNNTFAKARYLKPL
ncbi:hypothetical protein JCM19314_2319 [Nonlabens ulvanivorans]|uniref:Uncharacterized protein n=1 Tax=Nonlabens ulvanivorans TaxID=906888 RepID=A0A090QH56_NONUL|nr:hypothetical protein JCM19314_2319 [Nonlabens ulvanivorans]